MPWVNNSELLLAHDRFMDHAEWKLTASTEWSNFLETPFPLKDSEGPRGQTTWEVSEAGYHRIMLLCHSPYWQALLKAMLIRIDHGNHLR